MVVLLAGTNSFGVILLYIQLLLKHCQLRECQCQPLSRKYHHILALCQEIHQVSSISITFTHARSPDYLAPVKIGFGTIYTFITNLTDFLAKGFWCSTDSLHLHYLINCLALVSSIKILIWLA